MSVEAFAAYSMILKTVTFTNFKAVFERNDKKKKALFKCVLKFSISHMFSINLSEKNPISRENLLNVPKCEIFDRSDFHDF